MDDICARLANCFSIMFPQVSAEDIPHASPQSVEGWDSVASVTLLLIIEEEFDLDVDIEALDEFTSFERILTYLQKTKGAATSNACEISAAHNNTHSEAFRRGGTEAD